MPNLDLRKKKDLANKLRGKVREMEVSKECVVLRKPEKDPGVLAHTHYFIMNGYTFLIK